MKVRAILFAAVACLPAIAVNADATVLTGNALRNAVSGKTVYLKISGFELPIRYSATGTMVGSMGAVAASLARGDSASDRGKWWISGDQLCQRWTSWMDGKSYCYKLTLQGKSVRWMRNEGRSAGGVSAQARHHPGIPLSHSALVRYYIGLLA